MANKLKRGGQIYIGTYHGQKMKGYLAANNFALSGRLVQVARDRFAVLERLHTSNRCSENKVSVTERTLLKMLETGVLVHFFISYNSD